MDSPAFVRTPVTWGLPGSAGAPVTRPATVTSRRTSTPGVDPAAAASTPSTTGRRPVSHS